MTTYKAQLGDQVIKLPCHVLETAEMLLIDLAAIKQLTNPYPT